MAAGNHRHQAPRDPIGENRGKIVMKIIEGAEIKASIRFGDRLTSASTKESPECVVLDSLCTFRGAAVPSAPDDEAVREERQEQRSVQDEQSIERYLLRFF